jgi:pimeloyl-ACP methyl ester carboxylesterase
VCVLVTLLLIPCVSAQARKKAPKEPRVEEVVLTGFGGFELPGKVTIPAKIEDDEVERVIVLLHGSGPQDMDEDITAHTLERQENKPFVVLSDALVEAGFSVVRYHKRSFVVRQMIGEDPLYLESEEFKSFNDDPLEALVEDAAAVAGYARERFPQAGIHLLGHSQGTYLGLQVAHANDWIAGVGMIGFYGARLETMAFEQVVYRSMSTFHGIDGDGDGVLSAEEMAAHPIGMALAAGLAPIDPNGDGALTEAEYMGANFSNMLARELIPATYTRRETEYPAVGTIVAGLEIPLVFLSGMLDNQTPAYHTMAIQACNEAEWNKTNLTFRYYDGLGHALDPRNSYDELIFRLMDPAALADLVATLDGAFAAAAE